ncbi:hypothetical protein Dsin_017272 [Dipteronia sinensis]|uniref:CCHC-type domain-containing protein n=1 Tax=Dipteronia sinensis TaxID=43782 RepID=A0AAE0AF84_9ROSI|nr:hypothetical protein Dsin_017272 [Dipteronia sinensis]
MYGIQIMYSKAHQALHYALSLTYGHMKKPSNYCRLLVTCWNNKILAQSLTYIDGTNVKGRFGGTIFVATATDRNEQVYPIAYGYGDSENNLSEEWFLDCLKGALGHIDDLVFIFDRHASIKAGISKVFPYATHTICCWHFAENVKKQFHRKDVAAIMDKAARAYTEFKYSQYMGELCNLHKNAFDYVEATSPHKWSRVHYPQRREWNLDLTSLCADYYKRQTLINVYSVPIMPVGYSSSWVVPSDIIEQVVLNPKTKRQSGRPMEGRHASSSERTTTFLCRRCGQSSHNSMRCSNPPLINEGPSRIVPKEYHRKCSVCHQVGHNKQTCPNMESTVEPLILIVLYL